METHDALWNTSSHVADLEVSGSAHHPMGALSTSHEQRIQEVCLRAPETCRILVFIFWCSMVYIEYQDIIVWYNIMWYSILV